MYDCSLTKREDMSRQSLTVITMEPGDWTRFKLILPGDENTSRCVEPERHPRQGDERLVVRVLSDCSVSGVWRWSYDGLLEWSGGGCLASLNGQDSTVIAPCDNKNDDQIVEVGVTTTEGNETKIAPIDQELWKERMHRTRQEEMKLAKVESITRDCRI